jgi:hypothetical protein
MARKGIKASKISKTRSNNPKFIDWVTREHSRGTRDVAVEVSAPKGKRVRRQIAGGIKNNQAILHETTGTLPSMDVDETFWTEEPVMDQPKRVSSSTCPSWIIFYKSLSPSAPTLRNLFLEWAPT